MKALGRIQILAKIAALVAALVFLQQLIAAGLFRVPFDWNNIPGLILVNFGVVVGWLYFKNPKSKIPAFAVVVAAFFFAAALRVVLAIQPAFAFIERQIAIIVSVITMPGFLPASFAALLLLMLMPKIKAAYSRDGSNGFFHF